MSKRARFIARTLTFVLSFQLMFQNIPYIAKASTNNLISFAYSDFSNSTNDSLIQLTGNSSIQSPELELTPSSYGQAGSAFYKQKISVANDKSFSTFFKFRISNNIYQPGFEPGADGIVFVLNNNQNSLGSLGSGIGYSNITNSVGIEYDTYPNTEDPIYDPNNNHVGIDVNGSPTSLVTTTDLNGITLKSGDQLYSWIDYNGATKLIEIRLNNTSARPASPVLSYTMDLSSILNSTDVYAGFTSATGSAASRHAIQSWYFDSKYNPIDTDNNTYSFAPTSIVGTASPASNTKSTNLTFTVRDVNGNIMPGVNVGFTTNLGNLSSSTSVTDSNGQVSVNLSGASSTGNAVVKAVADGGTYTNVTVNNFIDSVAPTNQNSVLASNKTASSEQTISIGSTGDSTDTVWIAPTGTSVFNEGRTMTKATGTAGNIKVPSNEGSYKLYVVDAAGNISASSTSSVTVKNVGLFAGKYGKAQIFDVQRSPAYPNTGQQFNLSSFQNIFDSTTGQPVDWGTNNDRYVQFVNTSTQASASNPSAYTVSLDLFEANGTFVKRISNYGTVWGLGAKGLFYEGHDHYGYFISNQKGFSYGEAVSYTPDTGLVTDVNDLNTYNATTTVLDVGEIANLDPDTVLINDKFVKLGSSIAIVSSGNSKNTVWLAPAGTTTFAEGSTMTKASGTATSIAVPSVEGAYKLYIVDGAGNISVPSTKTLTVDSTAPTNENVVLASNKTSKGSAAISLVSSGDSGNTIWLAPLGTTTFAEGSTMTKASGTATSILAPEAEGNYVLYVVDAAENISPASSAVVTVDNTLPIISGVEDQGSYYIGRTITYEDNLLAGLTASYKKNNGEAINLVNGTIITSPGQYSITVKDAAGNEKVVSFEITAMPSVFDVLYNNVFKNLIDSIRNEFSGHNDLVDPYKTDTNDYIKSLEDKYGTLDNQVKNVITEVSAIPTSDDQIISQKANIQGILNDISDMTQEQKNVLSDQVTVLNNMLVKITQLENQSAVALSKTDLSVGYATGDSASKVTQNLNLITSNEREAAISWSSNNPSVISAGGQVTRPSFIDGNKTVELTATITKGEATAVKKFSVVVQKLPITDSEAVGLDKSKLGIVYEKGNSETNIYDAIGLNNSGEFGSTISWSSSDSSIISTTGKVTRPSYDEGDKTVTLTATIKKGSVTVTKTFEVVVKKLPQYDNTGSGSEDNTVTTPETNVVIDSFKDVVETLINMMTGGSSTQSVVDSVSNTVKTTVDQSVSDIDANAVDTELNSQKAAINVNIGDLLLSLEKNLADKVKEALSGSNDNLNDASLPAKINMKLIESESDSVILSKEDVGSGDSQISVDNLKDYTWYTVKVDVVVDNKVIGTSQQKILTPDRTAPVINSVSIKKDTK